ncbi:hypothetical protein [Natrialbaceae archaeon AArc-T1-2]|uniref:hypothetical protein n=1 Tax=Natrialbaceae archaeon AArc-T1-2 TaxID=3053904 RepID=UPI00255B29C8|nr:hypothetical protein [Natrialbaceae archaeon AArc-T1-2]WIV68712.1 hypothetical protein QQ977_14980 [Natrialbaceae archaeon AArc-T1-2]
MFGIHLQPSLTRPKGFGDAVGGRDELGIRLAAGLGLGHETLESRVRVVVERYRHTPGHETTDERETGIYTRS